MGGATTEWGEDVLKRKPVRKGVGTVFEEGETMQFKG